MDPIAELLLTHIPTQTFIEVVLTQKCIFKIPQTDHIMHT